MLLDGAENFRCYDYHRLMCPKPTGFGDISLIVPFRFVPDAKSCESAIRSLRRAGNSPRRLGFELELSSSLCSRKRTLLGGQMAFASIES